MLKPLLSPIEVGLFLRGRFYGNNSIITLNDIGEDSLSLLCYTNNTQCCRTAGPVREWYYPDGSMVRVMGSGDDIYRDRGPSVVRLHRRNSAMMPTGVFHCEIPDASGTSQNIYVGIYPQGDGEITLPIFHTV